MPNAKEIFYDGDLVLLSSDGSYRHMTYLDGELTDPLPENARVYWRELLLNPRDNLEFQVEQ